MSLRHRLCRMRSLLDSLEHQKPTQIWMGGDLGTIPLPFRNPKNPLSFLQLPPASTSSLAYRFSIFGNVAPSRASSSASLMIRAQLNEPHKLAPFLDAFGGSIVLSKAGRGAKRPTLMWHLGGSGGEAAAQVLLQHPSRKSPLLRLVADWPKEGGARKRRVGEIHRLSALLASRYFENEKVETWEELVELVDARGSLFSPTPDKMRITVTFSSKTLVESIRDFLVGELPRETHPDLKRVFPLQKRPGKDLKMRFCFSCQRASTVSFLLTQLLMRGLLLQREKVVALQGKRIWPRKLLMGFPHADLPGLTRKDAAFRSLRRIAHLLESLQQQYHTSSQRGEKGRATSEDLLWKVRACEKERERRKEELKLILSTTFIRNLLGSGGVARIIPKKTKALD